MSAVWAKPEARRRCCAARGSNAASGSAPSTSPLSRRRVPFGEVEGADPLAAFEPRAAQHLLRASGFAHTADILVGSFYDPALEEGCAFEELISFHGGLGGPQTRPFLLYPTDLAPPSEPIV